MIFSWQSYNPSTETWKMTGNMTYEGFHHKASVLTNGRVLATGGIPSDGGALRTTELYDPLTRIGTIGNMNYPRHTQTASVLTNGKVLVSGGGTDTSMSFDGTELYDSSAGNWTIIEKMHFQ
jgi:N-acetylneuraminic acid mutarotase